MSLSGLPGDGARALDINRPRGGDVLDAVHQTVMGFAGGTKALAQAMDMPLSTLQAKANRNNGQHVFHPLQLVQLMQVTGDASVLHAMAAELGRACVTVVPDQSGGDPAEAFMRFQMAQSEFTRAVADAMLDRQAVTPNMVRRVDCQAQALHAAADFLLATVRGQLRKAPEVLQ